MKYFAKRATTLTFLASMFLCLPAESYAAYKYKINPDAISFSMTQEMSKNSNLTSRLLRTYHFNHPTLSQLDVNATFETYIRSQDPSKSYLTQEEYDRFKPQFRKDNPVISGSYSVVNEIYKAIATAKIKSINYRQKLIDDYKDFPNLETNSTIVVKYENDRFPSRATWKQKQKDLLIRQIIELKREKPSMKWSTAKKRLKIQLRYIAMTVNHYNADKFETEFMNAYLVSVDAHSNFFSQKTYNTFIENINAEFEGIGVVLNFKNNGEVKVISIVEGGPTEKTGLIKDDDYILAVGSSPDNMTEVYDLLSEEVIDRIKGKGGTKVYLKVQHGDDEARVISITRGKVVSPDKVAKLDTFTEDGKTYGVLKFASFYRNLYDDVVKLLKNNSLDGLIVDVRNNGGGLVDAVLQLSSIFIDKENTPLFMSRVSSDGDSSTVYRPPNTFVFDKPVTVLINRKSASASEIFAGLIKDYQRGLLIGTTTYGKGTIQNTYSIAKEFNINGNLGYEKITIGKFYRVNGSSTQFAGVKPNIELYQTIRKQDVGESVIPHTLKHDEIASSTFSPYTQFVDSKLFPTLQEMVNSYNSTNSYMKIVARKDKLVYKTVDSKLPIKYNFFKDLDQQTDKYNLKLANLTQSMHDKPKFKRFKDVPKNFEYNDFNLEIGKKVSVAYFTDYFKKIK